MAPGKWQRRSGSQRSRRTIAAALSSITPSYAQSWKLALVSYPLEFGGVAIAILLCLAGSASLEQRIHERSSLAWHESSADRYRSWRAHNRSGWTRWLLAILALLAVCYGIAASTASVGTVRTVGVAAALVVLTLLLRATGYREVDRPGPKTQVRSTFALSIARWIRSSSAVFSAYRFLSAQAAAFVFATVVILGLFGLLNRALFDVEDSAGVFCGHAARPLTNTAAGDTVVQGFTNDQLCWPSAIAVAKGKRYLITVTSPGDWLDRSHRTDPVEFNVSGFDAEALLYYAAAPLKRRWGDRWLQPIARIGALGNDEYPLEPIDDVSPWPPDRRVLRSIFEAGSSGELFVYVNDAIWGIPSSRWAGMFTANNSGSATITVRRLPDPRYHEASAQPD